MSMKICKVVSVGKCLRKQPVGHLQMLSSTFVHKVGKKLAEIESYNIWRGCFCYQFNYFLLLSFIFQLCAIIYNVTGNNTKYLKCDSFKIKGIYLLSHLHDILLLSVYCVAGSGI